MKITFRTDYDGSIHSTNDSVIAENTISVDGLKTGLDIAHYQHQSIFKLLSHKVFYIALPADDVNDTDYSVVKIFVVRTDEGIDLWNEEYGYFYIENKDVIFTTEDEANEFVEKHQKYETMVALKKQMLETLATLNKDIDSLGAELGK